MGPQCEDGYTKLANELLEALCRIRIPGESMQVFLTILRKTYGFGKKMDRIALGQFCDATGLKKPNVVRALRQLLTLNVIRVEKDFLVSYGVNKNHETWKIEKRAQSRTLAKPINVINLNNVIKSDNDVIQNDNNIIQIDNGESLSKTITPLSKTITGVIQNDNKSLSKTIPTKEKKETTTKENKNIYADFVSLTPSEYQKLVERLGEGKTSQMIERLNNYIGSKGKRYKSHYHTILNWVSNDGGTHGAKHNSSAEATGRKAGLPCNSHETDFLAGL